MIFFLHINFDLSQHFRFFITKILKSKILYFSIFIFQEIQFVLLMLLYTQPMFLSPKHPINSSEKTTIFRKIGVFNCLQKNIITEPARERVLLLELEYLTLLVKLQLMEMS